jgi:hypothetical protein
MAKPKTKRSPKLTKVDSVQSLDKEKSNIDIVLDTMEYRGENKLKE